MISDETIERVREAADIVQLIGEHVNLKRSGADYRGPCPFHQGRNRNFSVSSRRGMYHCFVCHESGDVFTFFQKHLGMDWPGAVRMIAERVGVPVIETGTRVHGPDEREPLWEACAAAAEFFRRQLEDPAEGKGAREYLDGRGFGGEVSERHGFGWAPRDGALLREHLHKLGYDDARQLEAGLLAQRDDGELRPRFRGRLMIPILDAAGRHVGFGGRVIGEGEPKYLNSPETRVFSKANLLFNYNAARHAIRKEDRVLLVEGYFDAIRVAEAGIEWVVAPLGTALAEGQAQILAKVTKNAFLLYDGDAAGLRATFRAADVLLAHGMAVQVVTLPQGEDPDSFTQRHGGKRLLEQVDRAMDVFERKIQLLDRAGWFADLRRKRRALDRLLPTIRVTADPITRDLYLGRAAEVGGISKDLLKQEADRPERRAAMRPAPPDAGGGAPPTAAARGGRAPRDRLPPPAGVPGQVHEQAVVRLMLRHRDQVDFLLEKLGPDDFLDPVCRETFTALAYADGAVAVDELDLSPDANRLMERLQQQETDIDPLQQADLALRGLDCRRLQLRRQEIDRLPVTDELIEEKRRLLAEARELGCPGKFWK